MSAADILGFEGNASANKENSLVDGKRAFVASTQDTSQRDVHTLVLEALIVIPFVHQINTGPASREFQVEALTKRNTGAAQSITKPLSQVRIHCLTIICFRTARSAFSEKNTDIFH